MPPVHDTTPCMDYMLTYEDCLVDAVPRNMEVVHPSWPTMWPRLLTDGNLRPDLIDKPEYNKGPLISRAFRWAKPISYKVREKLWECEEERFVYKACLRRVIELKNDTRTRYPFWQPEENYLRAIGRRLAIPEYRYPTDIHHTPEEDDADILRKLWVEKIAEEGLEI